MLKIVGYSQIRRVGQYFFVMGLLESLGMANLMVGQYAIKGALYQVRLDVLDRLGR